MPLDLIRRQDSDVNGIESSKDQSALEIRVRLRVALF